MRYISAVVLSFFTFTVLLSTGIFAVPASFPLRQGISQIAQFGQHLGRLPGNTPIQLVAVLSLRNEAALKSLIVAQNAPGSPYYHRFLTPQQFTESFGPTPQSYSAVVSYLQGYGFQIETTPNRQIVVASGLASQAEQAFSTEIHTFAFLGKQHYANTTPPRVPAGLAGIMQAVQGLDSRELQPGLDVTSPLIMSGAGFKSPQGYSPSQIATAYDYPSLYGFNGTGKTIAVATSKDFDDRDLQTFDSTFGIKLAGYSRVYVQGNGQKGGLETTLDVEWSTALANNAYELVYIVSNALIGSFTTEYNRIVTDNAADVATSSWISCEPSIDPGIVSQDDGIFEQGVAQGQTWFIASGDSGAFGCGGSTPAVAYPTSSPFVTATGGTSLTLTSSGAIASETGWSRSGGGTSTVEPRPAWEFGSPYFSNGQRWMPDMAMDADPYTGMAFLWQGKWYFAGGTSIVAPFASALAAEIAQYKNSRLGLFAARLNQLASGHQYSTVLHDITSGNNGYYSAGPGWDPVTGWGSPDGYMLMLNY